MGAANDIKQGLTKSLATFAKQRKAEERHVGAVRWRTSRITEVRGIYLIEAANAVMTECYMKASDNGRLPATARQIYYCARPLIEERTDKPLSYAYFSQTLLPNYVNEHGSGWDVVFDDRGHFVKRTLVSAYQMYAASDRLSEAFDDLREKLDDEQNAESRIKVPDDLAAKVKAKLKENPNIPWHRAVRLIVDPDALPDDGDDEMGDDDLDDRDLRR